MKAWKHSLNLISATSLFVRFNFDDLKWERSHLAWAEAESSQCGDKGSILQIPSDDFVCLSDCCAGGQALMALAGGIRKGQSDGNLDSVFANALSGYWFCLEIFKEEAFMSQARDSGKVERGYWDCWSAPNADLAQSDASSPAEVGNQVRNHLYK